jgi:DMSO/TMAO reductase YedYZ molybdopterin-dependent catalytic subunit
MVMSSSIRLVAVGVLAALLSAGSAFAQRNSFEIRGDVQKPRSWSVDDVKKQFAGEIKTAKSTFGPEKQERTSTGIPLISLLKAAGLKTEETPKHYDLSFIVIIEAYDGYRAYFTFAELAAGAKENPVLLIWEENGKPIPDSEAPFRLRADGNDRSIFGITRITLVDGIKLANSLK